MAVVGYCALQTNISGGIEEIFFNSAHFLSNLGGFDDFLLDSARIRVINWAKKESDFFGIALF